MKSRGKIDGMDDWEGSEVGEYDDKAEGLGDMEGKEEEHESPNIIDISLWSNLLLKSSFSL